MRIVVAAFLTLVLAPHPTWADAIVFTTSDESSIDYGDWGAEHIGHCCFYGLSVSIDGAEQALDWRNGGTTFGASAGPLLSKTTETVGPGSVRTTYRYDGGQFGMWFDLINNTTEESVGGSFSAPIVGPMVVMVSESSRPDDDGVKVYFRLGKGWFDPDVADALGVRRRTTGGFVDDPFLIFGTGDPTSPDRTAWEGAPDVTIDVPEPASLMLLGVGAVAVMSRRRSALHVAHYRNGTFRIRRGVPAMSTRHDASGHSASRPVTLNRQWARTCAL